MKKTKSKKKAKPAKTASKPKKVAKAKKKVALAKNSDLEEPKKKKSPMPGAPGKKNKGEWSDSMLEDEGEKGEDDEFFGGDEQEPKLENLDDAHLEDEDEDEEFFSDETAF